MSKVEKIAYQVNRLPEPLQEEVLDFVEFLREKHHVDDDSAGRDEPLLSQPGRFKRSRNFEPMQW